MIVRPHVSSNEVPVLEVASVVWWLVCLPLDPRVANSNPAEAIDF
jgi:hypothetical protein